MNNIETQLSEKPLSIDHCYQSVLDPSCGGNCLFVGTVRNLNKGESVTHLDFEAYGPMAIKELDKIAQHCTDKLGANKVCIHHRTGIVGIKDIAVIIAISSKHRKEAFAACEYVIDTLKETVPIWKREYLTNGSYWVNARP